MMLENKDKLTFSLGANQVCCYTSNSNIKDTGFLIFININSTATRNSPSGGLNEQHRLYRGFARA